MQRPGLRVTAALVGAALLLTGCSSGDDQNDISTIERATPADSPPSSSDPAGTVQSLGLSIDSATFDPNTRTVIVTGDDGRKVLLSNADDPAAPPRAIEVDTPVHKVVPLGDGTALLAMDEQVGSLDLRSGEVTPIPVEGTVLSAARLPDGRIATGTDSGEIHIVDPEADAVQTVTGLASVDALAVVGDTLTALDRKQTSVTEIYLDDSSLGMALRVGEGASRLTTDPFGRILITDTPGDEMLVYSTDPLVLRQRFPVGPAPVGLAYDEGANTAWVTLTGTNEVVGFDLSTGVGVEIARFPTVHQPNSLAVDSDTGNLYVGSATGAGLQRIPTRAQN
ncbi:MAG: hypothetical protein GX610_14650 [Rhodococcus sp.]|nr:hypothetical protein [Rhodococcus sp. (in: high G+C Gram-positive bacteria)]